MVTALAAHAEEVVNELPIPAAAMGLLAFTGLMALLFVTFAFRSVGTRH